MILRKDQRPVYDFLKGSHCHIATRKVHWLRKIDAEWKKGVVV